jgi:hypothetical protein
MAKALQLVGDRLVTIVRHRVCALNSGNYLRVSAVLLAAVQFSVR